MAKPVRRRRAKTAAAACLMVSMAGGFVAAREERKHLEPAGYPEVHGEYLETMMSTATMTRIGVFSAFDLPTSYPW
jgi:hypothetical protein